MSGEKTPKPPGEGWFRAAGDDEWREFTADYVSAEDAARIAAAADRAELDETTRAIVEEAVADCVFCKIVAGEAPATIVRDWADAIAIVPHNPVVPGHVLVIPRQHVADVSEDPAVSASTMGLVAHLAQETAAANVITSVGEAATQTVFHLHWHVVPREPGDGLPLPWTPQQEAQRARDDR